MTRRPATAFQIALAKAGSGRVTNLSTGSAATTTTTRATATTPRPVVVVVQKAPEPVVVVAQSRPKRVDRRKGDRHLTQADRHKGSRAPYFRQWRAKRKADKEKGEG